jgi:hypothetical protein
MAYDAYLSWLGVTATEVNQNWPEHSQLEPAKAFVERNTRLEVRINPDRLFTTLRQAHSSGQMSSRRDIFGASPFRSVVPPSSSGRM